MHIFLNQLIQFYLNNDKSSPFNYTQYDSVAPQNGDRTVTTDM